MNRSIFASTTRRILSCSTLGCLAVALLSCSGAPAPAARSRSVADGRRADPAVASPRGDHAEEMMTEGEANARAVASYGAMSAAFTRGDGEAYFDGFAERLTCFHGRADLPRSSIRESREAGIARNATEYGRIETPKSPPGEPSRIHSIEIRTVCATPEEVWLADFGWTGRGWGDEELVFHRKLVMLRRDGSDWRLAIETSLGSPGCSLDPPRVAAPRVWLRLRSWWRDLLARCVGPRGSSIDDGYPGLGGSIGCDPGGGTHHGLSCEESTDECRSFNRELRELGLAVED